MKAGSLVSAYFFRFLSAAFSLGVCVWVFLKILQTGAGWLVPTSKIFFQPSEKTHGRSAVWALHTARLPRMGLDRGGLALPADGIRLCFAWQGASIHDPQWWEHSAKSHSQHCPQSFKHCFAWKYRCSECLNLYISAAGLNRLHLNQLLTQGVLVRTSLPSQTHYFGECVRPCSVFIA